MAAAFTNLVVKNPKRAADASDREFRRVFPYYAGYSMEFARELLSSLQLPPTALLLDPWNGAGTTSSTASELGLKCVGFDLNPVMVVAAKAALLSPKDQPSVETLMEAFARAPQANADVLSSDDSLLRWFTPESAALIRSVATWIRVNEGLDINSDGACVASTIGPLGALLYVALFRVARDLLQDFVPTNPTWVRTPKDTTMRIQVSPEELTNRFSACVTSCLFALTEHFHSQGQPIAAQSVRVGDARALTLPNESVDLVLTSPPYCTRIDYAVATAIEMAVIGVNETALDALRRSLMGTSTVPRVAPAPSESWGKTAISFISAVASHPSKASNTYYLKNHLEYFASLQQSTRELGRVTKRGGAAFIVIQDSYYKELHNDVPAIVVEMMQSSGFSLKTRNDFSARRSMAQINPKARAHRPRRDNIESVLGFFKEY